MKPLLSSHPYWLTAATFWLCCFLLFFTSLKWLPKIKYGWFGFVFEKAITDKNLKSKVTTDKHILDTRLLFSLCYYMFTKQIKPDCKNTENINALYNFTRFMLPGLCYLVYFCAIFKHFIMCNRL